MLRNIIDHIKLFFYKERELYIFYKKLLGFQPSNIKYYVEALTHLSSTMKEKNGNKINTARLEFLGDAILDAIIADILYKQFPAKNEGFLTSMRAKIVQRDNLNSVGIRLGLDQFINYSNHSQMHNSYISGNALEALIGAIYLDKGYRVCKKFIIKHIIPANVINNAVHTEANYKSKIIEWSQQNKVDIKFPLIESTIDENHSPVFHSAITLNDITVAQAHGYSKKESHQNAAKEAYIRIQDDNEFRNSIIIKSSLLENESES